MRKKRKPLGRPFVRLAVVACICFSGSLTAQQDDGQPSQLPLLSKDQLQYVGAFRVPTGTFGDSSFSYGGTACAFNPHNNSLFIVGHDHHQAIAEISIPEGIDNLPLGELTTAKVLQPFTSALSRIPRMTLEGNIKIGGLLVADGQLYGTAYEYYDGDANARDSHFKLSSCDLRAAEVEGLFRVGTLGGGFVGGYMCAVPSEWQRGLGAHYLTGQAALSIIGRTSSGPAAFGFNPTKLGPETAPAIPYVYYPLEHQLGWDTHPLFNGTTQIDGIFFAPQSRTIMFFGSHGTGEIGYGDPEEFNDPYRGGKGYHSANGEYAFLVWLYDALDFVAARQRRKQPWDVRPYDVWKLDFPLGAGNYEIGGVTFDPATGRLYVSQKGADVVGYDMNPLIHVFQLSTDHQDVSAAD